MSAWLCRCFARACSDSSGSGVSTGRSGSVLKLMAAIFEKEGIPWEHVEISDRSNEFSPNSSYTACVHEIAIGNADMCWGDFWTLAERRQLELVEASEAVTQPSGPRSA